MDQNGAQGTQILEKYDTLTTRDRGIKFKAYQSCPTIQEIVLVNQYFPSVEVWQRNVEQPENPHVWRYRHYGPDEIVELPSLNIQLAIEDIYRNLNFGDVEEEDNEE